MKIPRSIKPTYLIHQPLNVPLQLAMFPTFYLFLYLSLFIYDLEHEIIEYLLNEQNICTKHIASANDSNLIGNNMKIKYSVFH